MIEIDDEPACYIHGLISSDSDNDSDDMREFDEKYNLMKPPPYDYELIKNRIIIISSQNTPNVHVQQDQSTEEKNNNKTKKTAVTSKVAVTKKTENPAQKLNMAQIRNKKSNIKRKKVDMSGQVSCGTRKSTETIGSNQMLKTKVKLEYSKNKTIKKRSAAKLCDSRTREEKYLGLNITTREQFEKEFPSLDEVHKSQFRSACKLYKTKPTSSSISNKKKKKQFKPLKIENYYNYIPKGEYLPEVKNRRNKGTSITDFNCFTYKQLHLAYTAYLRKNAMENSSNKAENIVINTSSQKKKTIKKNKEVKQPATKPRFDTMLDSERYLFIDGKRKMKRKLKQSMKVLLNKNVLDKFGYVRHITQLAGGKTHTKICLPIDIYKYNYY